MITPITLEAMHILDAIDRRGSFSAAAEELNRAPSSLSYQIQKLEQELDLFIFDRSGHRAELTPAGKILLEQGRVILAATADMINDATSLANGWELDLTIAFDGVIPVGHFFPLVEKLAKQSKTRLKLQEEILAGGWEALAYDRADILVAPMTDISLPEAKIETIGSIGLTWVAAPEHFVHKRAGEFDQEAQSNYRVIAIADSARTKPTRSINVFEKQQRLTVTNFASKIEALESGLGIGTIPTHIAKEKIDKGLLKKISGSEESELPVIMAWKRNQMGKAKSWMIRNLPKQWSLK
ncbi:LysR family transcriptional regulator [Vibrio breoganii]|uniref:LysR family transcriptional regulator n=1 Tax=Vibrio breoganii TaxID=553239 RepID=UPI00030233AC|nr:LysR family transcriptional regulator [Vibrio breoganii]OED97153.1 LysR family transcriptional regulator [Vibrio breoganii ZF-29]PMG08711.1 LysR family transcriptional regulator [Vibrio breoganii]PMJ46156.1 LysR family transcriptional regulator [Vibrio breoganii]PMK58480.1 LysR family transcriptional regulator [Vibrio breoganii]PMK71609.1 LysR family transcriptional regulator [Vibrio breoganii]